MREDLKAKATVALIISFIAFSFGTGVSLLSGSYLKDPNYSYFNNNSTAKLPIIFNVNNDSDNQTKTPTITDKYSNPDSKKYYDDKPEPVPPEEPPTNNTNNNTP